MLLHVNGRNTELWMQEMPPHVTLILDHFKYEGEEPSRTASKTNYPRPR